MTPIDAKPATARNEIIVMDDETDTRRRLEGGSRGDSNLKSIPVSELILDEMDEMEQRAVWLALERLSGQVTKGILAISTPAVPKHGIQERRRQWQTSLSTSSIRARPDN